MPITKGAEVIITATANGITETLEAGMGTFFKKP